MLQGVQSEGVQSESGACRFATVCGRDETIIIIEGPTLIPILFAWSIEKPRPFPLNYGLSMYVLSLLTVLCVILTWILPASVNQGKGSLYSEVEEKVKQKTDVEVDAPLLANEVQCRVC